MGNCCRPFGLVRKYSSRFRQRKIVLLLVGLDNAGKSSTAKGLSKEPVENVIPTVGFNVVKLFHRGYSVIIYDLGGGAQIRDIWGRYFADVHGVIFVVDASDRDRLDECKKVFEELLVNETLAGKPVLLLANKQDKAGAFDELDIVEKLNVERLVNMQQCPTLVETCSAAAPVVNGGKRKLDPGIDNGYRWLLRRIIKDYDVLNKRVLADQEVQRLAIERERAEIRRRIEERREKENEEDNSDEGVCSPQLSNPFQPIQVLVKEMEEKEKLKKIGNGKHINKEQPVDEVIDLESSKNSEVPSSKSESAVDAVREQLRQKSAGQRKRRQILHRNNRTAPADEEIQLNPNSCPLSPEPRHSGALPPIRSRGPPPQSWAIVSNGKLVQNGFAWDLEKSLDIVLPPANGKRPQTGGSDSDDVITQLR